MTHNVVAIHERTDSLFVGILVVLLLLIIDALLLQHNSQNEDVGMSVCCCCYHNLGKDCLQLNVRYPLYPTSSF
jgi:hypothetical protein